MADGGQISKAEAAKEILRRRRARESLVAYSQAVELDWGLGLRFTAAALIGMFSGQALARKVPAAGLQRLFGLLLLGVAALIVVQEFF